MDSGSDVDGNKPVDRAINRLKTFLTSNPSSKIEERDADDDTVVVKSPWGDDTIEIVIPDEDDGLWSALNSLILPPRFSAIYHVDYKKLEIIYSAFPLDDAQKEVVIRSFDFEFDGKTYRCRFGKSSEKLMVIAEHTKYIGMGYTQHRNMLSFTYYVTAQKDSEKSSKIAGIEPISFWIDDIDWNEDNLVRLSRHLNFYMSYFDSQNPTINIFEPKRDPVGKPRERYISGYFPSHIRASNLNSNLLHYWDEAMRGDNFQRFRYSYQIVEFASFYYLEEGIKVALRKALNLPNIRDELDNIIIEIMDTVSEQKTWEGTKMQKLLREAVDPNYVHREVMKNNSYFTKRQDFDGGFRLDPLIHAKTDEEQFSSNWADRFCKQFRDIRNGLSHGRELTTSGVIAPTAHNLGLIRPWSALATIVAGQVMLWKGATI